MTETAQAVQDEATTKERPWIEGRNGGRLRPGGSRGPNKTTTMVRNSVVAALADKRGGSGKDFWLKLKCGGADDRRVFAQVAARVIPVEVSGGMGEALTVLVQTLVAPTLEVRLPSEGTCVIGETASRTPIAAPNEERE